MKESYFLTQILDLVPHGPLKYWCAQFTCVATSKGIINEFIKPVTAEAYYLQHFDVHTKINSFHCMLQSSHLLCYNALSF